MLSTILVVILILMLVGALPTWGYSNSWGYGPGGIVGLLLIIVVVLALTGRIGGCGRFMVGIGNMYAKPI
jgi:Protein of unknown function (DUF3309)